MLHLTQDRPEQLVSLLVELRRLLLSETLAVLVGERQAQWRGLALVDELVLLDLVVGVHHVLVVVELESTCVVGVRFVPRVGDAHAKHVRQGLERVRNALVLQHALKLT